MDRNQPSAVPLLSQPVWLHLSPVVRQKLVQLFGLKRSGATETYMGRDSIVRVVSDGYTAGDLLAVSTEKMQELLGTDSKDFYGLLDDVLANIDSLLSGTFLATPELAEVPTVLSVPTISLPAKRRGRPRKNETTQAEVK